MLTRKRLIIVLAAIIILIPIITGIIIYIDKLQNDKAIKYLIGGEFRDNGYIEPPGKENKSQLFISELKNSRLENGKVIATFQTKTGLYKNDTIDFLVFDAQKGRPFYLENIKSLKDPSKTTYEIMDDPKKINTSLNDLRNRNVILYLLIKENDKHKNYSENIKCTKTLYVNLLNKKTDKIDCLPFVGQIAQYGT